jgi:hypothetical protein
MKLFLQSGSFKEFPSEPSTTILASFFQLFMKLLQYARAEENIEFKFWALVTTGIAYT